MMYDYVQNEPVEEDESDWKNGVSKLLHIHPISRYHTFLCFIIADLFTKSNRSPLRYDSVIVGRRPSLMPDVIEIGLTAA